MFQILPSEPERTRVRHDFYLLGKPSTEEERFMDWFSHTLNVGDIDLCENVQKGLHSRGYHQGRLVVDREHVEYSEHHVYFFQDFVRKALSRLTREQADVGRRFVTNKYTYSRTAKPNLPKNQHDP